MQGCRVTQCRPGLKTTRFSVVHGDARTQRTDRFSLFSTSSLSWLPSQPQSVGRQLSSDGAVRASRPLTPLLISVSAELLDCDWPVPDDVTLRVQFLAN